MGLDTVIRTYNDKKLRALYSPEDAPELPFNLAPSTVYPRGTILGQVQAAANAVQTLTVTGTPTGGGIVVNVTSPTSGTSYTFPVAFDSSAAAAQTAIRAVIGAIVTVTGGALPGTPLVFTLSGGGAGLPWALMTVASSTLSGGTNPAATIANTTTGARAGTAAAYVGAGATDPARCILSYDCATDAAGNVTIGSLVAGQGEYGYAPTEKYAPCYVGGMFKTSELVGLDAGAVVDLAGALLSGTVTDGVLKF